MMVIMDDDKDGAHGNDDVGFDETNDDDDNIDNADD